MVARSFCLHYANQYEKVLFVFYDNMFVLSFFLILILFSNILQLFYFPVEIFFAGYNYIPNI